MESRYNTRYFSAIFIDIYVPISQLFPRKQGDRADRSKAAEDRKGALKKRCSTKKVMESQIDAAKRIDWNEDTGGGSRCGRT